MITLGKMLLLSMYQQGQLVLIKLHLFGVIIKIEYKQYKLINLKKIMKEIIGYSMAHVPIPKMEEE